MEENNKAPDLSKLCKELINAAYNLIKKNIESSDGLESNVDRVARSMVSVKGRHINEHLRTALGINDRVIARAWQRVMDEAIELDKNSSTSNTDDLYYSFLNFHTGTYKRPSVLTEIVRNATKEADQPKKKDGTSAGNDSNTINHKEHQFSPTFVAIESILSISTSNPGVAGDINPFAQITDDGCFDESKMPWYEQIKGLRNLLVPL